VATQPVTTTGQQSFEQMAAARQAKIARQQALKETNNKLKVLRNRPVHLCSFFEGVSEVSRN